MIEIGVFLKIAQLPPKIQLQVIENEMYSALSPNTFPEMKMQGYLILI